MQTETLEVFEDPIGGAGGVGAYFGGRLALAGHEVWLLDFGVVAPGEQSSGGGESGG